MQLKTLFSTYFRTPAPSKPLADESHINRLYHRYRWQVFIGAYLGYAGYYLVRNNAQLVSKILLDQHLTTKSELGIISNTVLIAYGISKFFSGIVADRSNSKLILSIGLFCSSLINIFIGLSPAFISNLLIFSSIMFINGLFQGMGWAPCGRSIINWFSTNERGSKMSIWNTAHNVGAAGAVALGLQLLNDDWRGGFLIPGFIGIGLSVIVFLLVVDNPPAIGLPTVQTFRNDPDKIDNQSNNYSVKETLTHLLTNRLIISLAVTNVFVYTLRYGVLYWIPVYLSDRFGQSVNKGLSGFGLFEIAGIIGTIICGWLSDKYFKGNRSKPALMFCIITMIFIALYAWSPSGTPVYLLFTYIFIIGAAIYGPVMIIGLQAIDLSPNKLAGSAAGFTGLFGYLLGATLATGIIGSIIDHLGWNASFIFMMVIALLSIVEFLIINKMENNINQKPSLERS